MGQLYKHKNIDIKQLIRCNSSWKKENTSFNLTIKQLESDRVVHVLPPVFSVSGNWDFPVGPLTCQVYANTGDHRGLVLEAEGSEV